MNSLFLALLCGKIFFITNSISFPVTGLFRLFLLKSVYAVSIFPGIFPFPLDFNLLPYNCS